MVDTYDLSKKLIEKAVEEKKIEGPIEPLIEKKLLKKEGKEKIEKALFDEKFEVLIKAINDIPFLYPEHFIWIKGLLDKKAEVISEELKLEKAEVQEEICELFKARCPKGMLKKMTKETEKEVEKATETEEKIEEKEEVEVEKAEQTEAQEKAAKKYELSEETREKIGRAGGKEREEMPADMFLKPNRTYPWKLGGKPSKKLLVAAYRRAITQNEPTVAMKARRLLKEHFGVEFEKPEQAKKSMNDTYLFQKAHSIG